MPVVLVLVLVLVSCSCCSRCWHVVTCLTFSCLLKLLRDLVLLWDPSREAKAQNQEPGRRQVIPVAQQRGVCARQNVSESKARSKYLIQVVAHMIVSQAPKRQIKLLYKPSRQMIAKDKEGKWNHYSQRDSAKGQVEPAGQTSLTKLLKTRQRRR